MLHDTFHHYPRLSPFHIQEWIPSVSVSACDLDQTFSSSMIVHQRKANEEEEDEENLNRAIFLLSVDDDVSVCRRLQRIYINGDMTHKCLQRVIACLLALVTDSQKLKVMFAFPAECGFSIKNATIYMISTLLSLTLLMLLYRKCLGFRAMKYRSD